jgi:hypothetical protein
MKIVAPYEALDGVRGQLPGRFDIQVELVQGGKDKMVMKAISMKPVSTPASANAKSS